MTPLDTLSYCAIPGCGNLVWKRRKCPGHTRTSAGKRPSAHRRGYGIVWRAIRAAHLEREPKCRFCGKRATEVDHIKPKSEGGTDERSNLRSLCKPCHSRRTAKEQSNWG